jgi:hypothetical protein
MPFISGMPGFCFSRESTDKGQRVLCRLSVECGLNQWTKRHAVLLTPLWPTKPNCIIFYNATLLSKLLAHRESRDDMQGAALVKQASLSHGNTSIFTDATNSVNSQSLWMWTKSVRELAEIRIGTETALAA